MKSSTGGRVRDRAQEAVAEAALGFAREVARWSAEEERTLEEIEEEVRERGQGLLAAVVGQLCELQGGRYAAERVPCDCGAEAAYVRWRTVTTMTRLGLIRVRRAYYLCGECHQGQAPLDRQLGICAGGISTGLDAWLASLGSRMAFEEAAEVLEELTSVAMSANRIRQSTEQLGALINAHEDAAIEAAWDVRQTPPPGPETGPDDLYISMDGTMANTREEGWKELKVAAIYTTTITPGAGDQAPEVRARDPSYRADLATPEQFGKLVWLEAHRCGLEHARRVIVIGDGAAWIWKQTAYHFPEAVQIVDWYHATRYIWSAANDWYGEQTPAARAWAEDCEDLLWNGRVDLVVSRMAYRQATSEAAREACTYFRNNRHRMRYPEYRQAGIQIGSGAVESGCKQLISARLKQAGMRWALAAARHVAKARSWLKSGRWTDALALRPPPTRSYHRATA